MKVAIKLVLASALFAAGAASANNLVDPSTGSGGDLVLLIGDTATGQYYAYDSGTTLDQVKTVASIQGDLGGPTNPGMTAIFQTPALSNGTLSFSTVINVGPNIASYLATDANKSDFRWAIVSADATNSNFTVAGTSRLLWSSTSTTGPNALGDASSLPPATSNVVQLFGNINSAAKLAAPLGDVNASVGLGSPDAFGQSALAGFYGSTVQVGAGLGTAQYLYLMASDAFVNNTTTSYVTTGTFSLSQQGVLTFSGTAVPIPAAIWLLGSGLLGLVGVSRRRRV
jgi:hypothetical protein